MDFPRVNDRECHVLINSTSAYGTRLGYRGCTLGIMISIFHAHIHSLWMRGVPTTTIESATIRRTTKGNWHCWKSFLNEYIHCRGFLLYCSHKTCYPSKDLLKSISLVSLKLGLLRSPFLIILAFSWKKRTLIL